MKRDDETHDTSRLDDLMGDFPPLDESTIIEEEALIPWVIELRLMGTAQIIRVPVKEHIILGRSGHEHKSGFDIDFLPYQAQVKGVSRKHACLSMENNRLLLEDMASLNGTYLNGKRLQAYQPVRLRNGDQIRLGRLDLQVHFLIQPQEDDKTLSDTIHSLIVPRIAKGQHLLILDDNKAIAAVVRLMALQAGFLVTVCHELSAAIAHWDTGMIDALFVELLLEEGSGLSLIRYVRQQGKTVPIVVTVSSAGGYQEAQARSHGANELLVKPLAANQIVAALAAVADSLAENKPV